MVWPWGIIGSGLRNYASIMSKIARIVSCCYSNQWLVGIITCGKVYSITTSVVSLIVMYMYVQHSVS